LQAVLSTFWMKALSSLPFISGQHDIHLRSEQKENMELINANWKLCIKEKYRWIRKRAKIQEKLYLQDLYGNSGYNDRFPWMKKNTFLLNWTSSNKHNELIKIDSNDYVMGRQEQNYRKKYAYCIFPNVKARVTSKTRNKEW